MFDKYLDQFKEVGYVDGVVSSIVQVVGLPSVKLGEIVVFESGTVGQVMALKAEIVEILLMSNSDLRSGERAARTGQNLQIPVGPAVLGQTLNALGKSVAGVNIDGGNYRSVDVVPSDISTRKKINQALETGCILVDLLLPLGRGQRELVLGDRKTGKTHFLLQSVLSQARLGNICVYAAIGKKRIEIKKFEEFFVKHGVASNVVIVASSSQDSAGEIYLTPYTAMTIAEHFRDAGRDVLVIMDDLSTHAKFYRELSLLSRKFPGRDAYPGDIFYIHSRLLERAGNFQIGDHEVSITCLPVAETALGDITGYIQTNLMSMTDGHIFFDTELFFQGRRPAINPFISVTRVGRQTQSKLRKQIGQELMTILNNFDKTQSFFKFGAELGEASRQVIAMGEKIYTLFNQPLYSVVSANLQLVLFGLIWQNLWNGADLNKALETYEKDNLWRKSVEEAVSESENLEKFLRTLQINTAVLTKPWH